MNNRRPSKPNLHSVLYALQAPTPTRLRQTYFFFSLPDSTIAHSIYQYEIGPFLTASQSAKQSSHRYGYGEKRFW